MSPVALEVAEQSPGKAPVASPIWVHVFHDLEMDGYGKPRVTDPELSSALPLSVPVIVANPLVERLTIGARSAEPM